MPRIKVHPPEKFFDKAYSIPVRITDLNYGNHVGNDSIVSILQEARMQWLHSYGFTEMNIEGTGLIMADLVIEFRNEALYGDTLQARVGLGEITRVGFELIYALSCNRAGKELAVANARTTMICFDYAARKVIAIPEVLKNILT